MMRSLRSRQEDLIIARLEQPMLQLRAALGPTGSVTDATALLRSGAEAAGETDPTHRTGVHALESTWASEGADAAMPVIRQTRGKVGHFAARNSEIATLLEGAHSTSSRAASDVDDIIAAFRADAKAALGTQDQITSREVELVVGLAAQRLRESLTTVDGAQEQLNGYTRRLYGMEPLTSRTQPYGAPSVYAPGQPWLGRQVPADPALAAQQELRRELIGAGVELGTAAIGAGVDVATHLIDKVAETTMHAIDEGSTVAQSAVTAAITGEAAPGVTQPGTNTPAPSSPGGGAGAAPLFNFGGPDTKKPENGDPTPAPAPAPELAPPPPVIQPESTPPPVLEVEPPPSQTPDVAPPPQPEPVPQVGPVMPPPLATPPSGQRRDGQAGVTAPASATAPLPAAAPDDT